MEKYNISLEVGRLFREVISLMHHRREKYFENMGITVPQGMVLGVLMKKKKMKISELSECLFQSNSTVSGIIDRLEKQGMVERERSESDKRVVYVKLTSKAEEIHKGFCKIMEENWDNLMGNGTPEDIEKIVEGLNTLKRLLTQPKN